MSYQICRDCGATLSQSNHHRTGSGRCRPCFVAWQQTEEGAEHYREQAQRLRELQAAMDEAALNPTPVELHRECPRCGGVLVRESHDEGWCVNHGTVYLPKLAVLHLPGGLAAPRLPLAKSPELAR